MSFQVKINFGNTRVTGMSNGSIIEYTAVASLAILALRAGEYAVMFSSAAGPSALIQRAPYSCPFPIFLTSARRFMPRFLCLALPIALLSRIDTPASAQAATNGRPFSVFNVASPLPSTPLGELNQTGTLSHFDAIGGIQTDVLFGRNTEGPYTLSWKKARANSETVDCDGRALQRDIDYVMDSAAGTIRFAFPLSAATTVRITYAANTPDAIRSAPEIHLMHWDLLNKGKNRLRLRTQLRDEAANVSASPATPAPISQFGINALQWTGSTPLLRTSLLTSQLDSRLFMDLQGGDWMDRGGMSLSQQAKMGKTEFSVAYARAGAQFTQSDESGIATGQETLGAKLGATPAKGVTVSSGVQQTTSVPTAHSKTATTKTIQANGDVALELAALAKTKLSSHIEDRFDKDGAHLNSETNVQLPRLPVAQTQLSGGVQYSADAKQERTVGLFAVASKPQRYLEVNGDARLRYSQLADDAPDPNARNTYGLKINFAPSKRLKLGGGTIFNPEANGGILNGQRNTLNLESDWGFLTMRGQLGVDQDFDKSRSSGTSEVGIDLHFTRFDIFSTGFRGQGLFAPANSGTGTYLLGFKHRLGSAFDLMLNGELTRPLIGGDASKTEIKTEAKLGLRF